MPSPGPKRRRRSRKRRNGRPSWACPPSGITPILWKLGLLRNPQTADVYKRQEVFFAQLEQWNDEDEYTRCIQTLNAIPENWRNYRTAYALRSEEHTSELQSQR